MRKCCVCKIEKPLIEFTKDGSRKDGIGFRCKPCNKVYSKKNYHRLYKGTNKTQFTRYKANCKRVDREFSLSYLEFQNLLNGDCFFCGQTNAFGVDRLDNEIGYVTNNCVSCCKKCNWMKRTYTTQDFLNHMKKIIAFVEGKLNENPSYLKVKQL